MIRSLILTAALALALTQTACVSMSSLQTAETLEKGKNQVTFGGGYYSSEETGKKDDTKFKMPYLETSYREGIAKDWDAGLKITLIGSAAADVKYRFFDSDRFDMAVGGGLGYMGYSSGSGETELKTTLYDFMVPLYLSYRVADPFAVYLTPRYVLRVANHSGEGAGSDKGTSTASLVGGAGGVKIGQSWGVYLEAAYQKDVKSNFDLMQYNLSFFWGSPTSMLSGLTSNLASGFGL